MSIPLSIKRQACEGLLHSYPKKTLARELNISCGAIRDWSIFVEHDFFDWVNKPCVGQRKHQLSLAAKYWFDHYPIGYSDVARLFGLRPAGLYAQIRRLIDKLPVKLRPARIRFWAVAPTESMGGFVMAFEKLSDIPSDRPLNLAERKALMRELEDARARLICAESLLEVAVESCKDELKKRIDAATRANQKGLSIVRICQVMGVARSSFYHKQKISIREIRDNQLAQWIKLIEDKFFYTIGRRRMGALIKREFGHEVSEGRIQRVMNKYHLGARIRRIRTAKPHAGKAYQASLPPNLLKRHFQADKPGSRLVTDVTYVPYYENNQWHWGYLSLVQDLFDRSITAWVFERKQDNRLAN